MKNFVTSMLKKLIHRLDSKKITNSFSNKNKKIIKKNFFKKKQIASIEQKENFETIRTLSDREIQETYQAEARDVSDMMEVPFLALSKDRREPIIYKSKSKDGEVRVKITPHYGHYLASIYDWDIILVVANKIQETINSGSDIPSQTIKIARGELLKALQKHDGKKEEKDLRASLSRLRRTGIDTSVRNKDGRYYAGFGFLDDWSYTDRRDKKEISITLSKWLYDGICAKGSLLKVDPEYFEITSGLKKFLYRTARKHVGGHSNSWEFSVEKLYEKSGSIRDFKKFKYDLKKVVEENDIPGFDLKWVSEGRKFFVSFKNIKTNFRYLNNEKQQLIS